MPKAEEHRAQSQRWRESQSHYALVAFLTDNGRRSSEIASKLPGHLGSLFLPA